MSGKVRFQRPSTTQETVLAAFRRAILRRELVPGEQILQDRVAERLGVSRVPVREALRILEGEGHVSHTPHRGYFVTELTFDELLELYRVRELLESEAVRSALPAIGDAELAQMEEAIVVMEHADPAVDVLALTEANRRFHLTIVEPCGLPRLTRMVRQLWDQCDAYRSVHFPGARPRTDVDREHREILRAVRLRDAEAVVALLTAHRTNALHGLAGILGDPAGDDPRAGLGPAR